MDPEDSDSDPNRSLNLITSSFYHFGHILKILSKLGHKFLSYVVHKQTNRRTNKNRRKHNLLGGGNYVLRNAHIIDLFNKQMHIESHDLRWVNTE